MVGPLEAPHIVSDELIISEMSGITKIGHLQEVTQFLRFLHSSPAPLVADGQQAETWANDITCLWR